MARWILIIVMGSGFGLEIPRATAWNSIGHMAIAKLAYDQLDQKRQIAHRCSPICGPAAGT
jgi:hypothetical protein